MKNNNIKIIFLHGNDCKGNKYMIFKNMFFIVVLMSANYLQAQHVEYSKGTLEHNDAFYSADGWGREPMASHLKMSGEALGDIFSPAVPELSVTAKVNKIAIGQRKCEWWHEWLNQFPKNLIVAVKNHNQENVKKYVAILQKAHDVENNNLLEEFRRRNIPLNKIVHNCGLMVLKEFQNRGIGNNLQKMSLQMLKEKGIEAIVCETTNTMSAKIMQKQGFIKFVEFSYEKDFQINGMDDFFTIWYKDLS